ncbi:MAG: hydrolase [Bacillota bacterium]|nr:hydrolase [Bacillota bacterium]
MLVSFNIYITNSNSEGIDNFHSKSLNKKFKTKIKSGNLSTDYNIEDALNDLDKFGLNTLNVPVAININNLSSSDMNVDKASEEKAIELIKILNEKDINVILEPYPWIDNGSKVETDWKPDNMDEFFGNWKSKVLKKLVDDVAVPYKVDAMIVGSNFVNMEYNEAYWCDTIDYLRKDYKGLITYKTNFWTTAVWEPKLTEDYKKKLNNKLFSKVDYISIAAYFELTNNNTNTVENLVKAIQSTQIYDRKQNIKKEIKNFNTKWKKPVFFGELGFPRTDKASVHPFDAYQPGVKANDIEQANCFEAYRRVFEKESWNLGFSVFAVGEHGPDKHYYPSEQSTAVIKKWYGNSEN